MSYKLFKILDCQKEKMSAMDTITCNDIKSIFKSFSVGKFTKVKLGKISIVNEFYPILKQSGLEQYEGHYAFYAFEKSANIFLKAKWLVFILPLGADTIFVVPRTYVSFETPNDGDTATILLSQQGKEHIVCTQTYANKEHSCFFEKMCILREFSLEATKIICTKDVVVHYFRWTEPDPWVKKHFTIKEEKKPMFFLRNEPKEIPGWSVQISYPPRPALWGYEVEEW